MEQERIQRLVNGFNEQKLNAEEQIELERLIESGKVDIQLLQINTLQDSIENLAFPSPAPTLDQRFYEMLAHEKASQNKTSWFSSFPCQQFMPKLAFASLMLIIGMAAGWFIKPASQEVTQMQALSQQVSDLKEMMMLSLLEKESATERLKAVSLTQDMSTVSSKVTDALLQTLNQDENVNVRLAALDALKPYIKQSNVREALIRSIALQQSPLVQLALADLMTQIQEKSSVKELEKIIQSDRTPNEVKKRIKESIKVLS